MTGGAISAIMVSWQTGPALFGAIDAVLADPEISELVLVDHENPDNVRARLDALAAGSDRLKIIRTNRNPGFGAGCNIGAEAAKGEILLFINPDARPETGAARKLAKVLEGQPETAIAGARILDDQGREQSGSRRRELTLWRAIATFTGLAAAGLAKPFGMVNEPVPDSPVRVAAVSGAAFMMTRQGFEVLGGFDEAYFLHVEDIDLCRRSGCVWFVPEAVVHHVGGTSDASPFRVEWAKANSFFHYFWKFSSDWEKIGILMVAPFLFNAIFARAFWRQMSDGNR